MSERRRVEIGMGIGQVVHARLDDDALSALRKSVESGEGWHEVQTDDGTLVINVQTVVFIRIPDQQSSIGFSSS